MNIIFWCLFLGTVTASSARMPNMCRARDKTIATFFFISFLSTNAYKNR